MNRESSEPAARTDSARSGSRNMWYKEVGGTRIKYSANTTLEKPVPKTDFTAVDASTSAYHTSTVAMSGR
jgi:hypothetical protein